MQFQRPWPIVGCFIAKAMYPELQAGYLPVSASFDIDQIVIMQTGATSPSRFPVQNQYACAAFGFVFQYWVLDPYFLLGCAGLLGLLVA